MNHVNIQSMDLTSINILAKDIYLEAADLVIIVHTSIKIFQTFKKVVNIQEQLNY